MEADFDSYASGRDPASGNGCAENNIDLDRYEDLVKDGIKFSR
jgi:hypothetical protein